MIAFVYISDLKLVEEIQHGDSGAKNYLVHRYQAQIIWLIKKKIGYDHPHQGDLVNDTMIAVLESLQAGNFDPGKGKELGSYIFGITSHKIATYFREKQKLKHTEPIDNEFVNIIEEKNKELLEQENEQLILIRRIIKRLHPKYQQVFHLRYTEEMSMKEIGEKLGKTEQQIINLHDYALKKIRIGCKKMNLYSIFFPFLLIITIGVNHHKFLWIKNSWVVS